MDWAVIFGIAALVNGVTAYFSGRPGLMTVSFIFGFSWLVCNTTSALTSQFALEYGWSPDDLMHVRAAAYSIIDAVLMSWCFGTIITHRLDRMGVAFFLLPYVGMLTMHFVAISNPEAERKVYYTALDVLFSLQLLFGIVWGVAETALRVCFPDIHARRMEDNSPRLKWSEKPTLSQSILMRFLQVRLK